MAKKTIPPLVVIFVFVALPALVLDQVSKYWAQQYLERGRVVKLLGNWFSLQLVHNPGAAFSLASQHTWVFTLIASAVCAFIVWYGRRVISLRWQIALGLLAGGALGNLLDRLVQPPGFMHGHVVDFLNYKDWFVGNIADVVIVLAMLYTMYLVLVNVPATRADQLKQTGLDPRDIDDEEFVARLSRETDVQAEEAEAEKSVADASSSAPAKHGGE